MRTIFGVMDCCHYIRCPFFDQLFETHKRAQILDAEIAEPPTHLDRRSRSAWLKALYSNWLCAPNMIVLVRGTAALSKRRDTWDR